MSIALYPHKSGLGLMEPVAQIGHNVAILSKNRWEYRRVTRYRPITPFQFLDLGAVALQTPSAKTDAPNLELLDDEFGQFRWWPLDNAQVRLWMPASTQDYALRNIVSVVDPSIVLRDPCLHLTEFYVWEQDNPHFDATNIMDYALTQIRLVAMGFRFLTEALPAATEEAIKRGREPCVYVQAQAMAAG